MTHDAMVTKLCELQTLNAERRAMLRRLTGLGSEYPDMDLQDAYEAIKTETEQRIRRTESTIDTLEMLLEVEEVSA